MNQFARNPRQLAVGAVLVLLGAAVGYVVAGARVSDPTVQAGIVGALAGIVAGLAGATIGSWSAATLTDRTIADAQAARREAQEEARRLQFIDQRREAIVNLLRATSAAFDDAERIGESGPEAVSARKDEPLRFGIEHKFQVLTLVAPDLALDAGRRYVDANRAAIVACLQWGELPNGPDGRTMPKTVKAALEARAEASSQFIAHAVFHLGVNTYTAEALAQAVAKIETQRMSPRMSVPPADVARPDESSTTSP